EPLAVGFPPALAHVPDVLRETVVRAATASLTGTAARAGAVSASVAALSEEVLRTMLLTKVRALASGGAVLMAALGGGAAATGPKEGKCVPRPEPARAAVAPRSRAEPAEVKVGDRLLVEVLEALPGRPISGERLVRPDGTISLGFYGNL